MLSLFSHSVISESLQPHELQHAQLPCPLWSPGVCSNSCPLNRLCHPTISSSVIPFSCLQSFQQHQSLRMSWLFIPSGQTTGASASPLVLPMYSQGWFPLGLTSLISLLFKGLSRVFSSLIALKHQFFSVQASLWSESHTHTWLWEIP